VDLDRLAEAEAALAEAEAIAARFETRAWFDGLLESTRKAVEACRKRLEASKQQH